MLMKILFTVILKTSEILGLFKSSYSVPTKVVQGGTTGQLVHQFTQFVPLKFSDMQGQAQSSPVNSGHDQWVSEHKVHVQCTTCVTVLFAYLDMLCVSKKYIMDVKDLKC